MCAGGDEKAGAKEREDEENRFHPITGAKYACFIAAQASRDNMREMTTYMEPGIQTLALWPSSRGQLPQNWSSGR